MHHPTDRIRLTTAFVTPVVEHWLNREIAQWVHPLKDRSDNLSHHERTLLPWSYISLLNVMTLCLTNKHTGYNITIMRVNGHFTPQTGRCHGACPGYCGIVATQLPAEVCGHADICVHPWGRHKRWAKTNGRN